MNNLLNTSPRIFLSLGSRNSRHLIVKTRITLLSLPSRWSTVAEQHFNLLDSLAASFWIREPELNGTTEAKCSENDKESPADVEKCGWDEETDGEVKKPCEFSSCLTHNLCEATYQFPIAAIPIPVARVSRDHTSAAYTQHIGARVSA
jgi:hypothetical protein